MPDLLLRPGMDRAAHSRLKVHHETNRPHNNTADAARAQGSAPQPVAGADRFHGQSRTGARIERAGARTARVKTASRAHGQGPQEQLTALDDPGRLLIFTGQPTPPGDCFLTASCGCSWPTGSGAGICSSRNLRGNQQSVDTPRRAPVSKRHQGPWRRGGRFDPEKRHSRDMSNAYKPRCSSRAGSSMVHRLTTSTTVPSRQRCTA